jgi:hypothetical protein
MAKNLMGEVKKEKSGGFLKRLFGK